MTKTQKRITGRPNNPMIPKGSPTLTRRPFKNGGKKTTKCK
jgi:hypothetical protein